MDTQAYDNARAALRAQDYKAAQRAFKIALDSLEAGDDRRNTLQSYYGLTQVMNDDSNGLLLCRDAASNQTSDGDVFLNLACAEWHSGNRKRAIEAVRHGLEAVPAHRQLKQACARLDCRRKCCIGLLSRNHKLNRLIGRLLRRPLGQQLTVHQLLFEQ